MLIKKLPAFMKKRGPMPSLLNALVVIAFVLITLFFSVYVLPAPANRQRIVISEVLSSNRNIIADEDGGFHDFIELYNAGEVAVNLSGWYLSDNDMRPRRWRLPEIILEPGEFVFFFASGMDFQQADGIWHTNFSVSADGTEPVLLTQPNGILHDRISPFATLPNISFGLCYDGDLAFMSVPTPGLPNRGPFFPSLDDLEASPFTLIISEYMTQNYRFFPDENGLYHDWVEIHNPGSETVNLQGWFLSDNEENIRKWRFPENVYIEAGGFLVLHLSGLDAPGHVPFSLSARDGSLTLSDPNGFIADNIALHRTPLFASFGRGADGREGFFATPTPGAANIGIPMPTIAELEWDAPTLIIMEYMSNNNFVYPDMDGDFNDWVEIFNFGEEAVSLYGISLSDRLNNLSRWTFPDYYMLMPGERMVIQLSLKNLPGHANFALSTDDDGLFISDRYGRIIDAVSILRPPSHVSHGRDENDFDRWLFFPRPTPGRPNDTIGFEELAGIIANPGLFISQVSPEDWLMITNASDEHISLAGWTVANSAGNRSVEYLPDTVLAPGRSLRVNLQNLNIRTRGENLMLSAPEGHPVDMFATGTLRTGITAVRHADNLDTRVLVNRAGAEFSGTALPVYASVDDLAVEPGTAVELWTRDPYGEIFFTLDGNIPTINSRRYTEPIIIERNTVLRARVIAEDRLPGVILTRTYLIDMPHDIPVVTLVSEPAGLFSHYRGIFADGPGWTEEFPHRGANFWWRVERAAHFAFYEYGYLRVEADAGMRIHGAFSRAEPQKSIAVFFRGAYGLTHVAYPLIPHISRTLFDSLILRTSGQDWRNTKLRDAFIHNSVYGVTNVTVMAARPVAVYINGQYWGLYNLREKINDDYFRINHGVPNDEIDIIRFNSRTVSGSNEGYLAMVRALSTMNMNTPEAYDFVNANIDLDNWIDYWIIVTFFGNTDTGNIRFYRFHGEEHRWRWNLFDQDWALFPTTYQWNPFSNMLRPQGHGVGHFFCTVIARALMRNDVIRNRFLERYAELLSYVLSADRLLAILDDYVSQIENEMPMQIARWRGPSSMSSWNANLQRMRTIIGGRDAQIRRFMQASFNLSEDRMLELFPEG